MLLLLWVRFSSSKYSNGFNLGILTLIVTMFMKQFWALVTEIIAGGIILIFDFISNQWINNFLILLIVVRGKNPLYSSL